MKKSFALPPALDALRNYVDGEFVESAQQFDNVSPIDGSVLAKVHEADAALVDRAVRAARRALDEGPLGRTTVEQRAAALHRVADIIARRFEEFLAAEVADTGRPVEQARKLDVYRGIANFRTFADLGKAAHGEFYETHLPDGTELINYTKRKPLGVVASISPWNLPILSLTWKAAPALICGNTIICKPLEETPSSAVLIAEAFHEEGATVVTGGGVPHFGDARDNGAFVQPTIWTGLPDTARCVREEVFGPVCHIAPFDSEDEVLKRANDSDYGLAATVWTTNLSRAHRVAPKLHVGIVWINTWFSRDLRTPFGGTKLSGIGREGGRWSLDFYCETTNICIKV